jgi:urocanate hydratase
MSEEQATSARKWIDEAEEDLGRTGEALRTAWSETKEARMATLESAREAAARLGRAIDQGIEAARDTWDSSQQGEPPDETSAESESVPGPTTSDDTARQEEE